MIIGWLHKDAVCQRSQYTSQSPSNSFDTAGLAGTVSTLASRVRLPFFCRIGAGKKLCDFTRLLPSIDLRDTFSPARG